MPRRLIPPLLRIWPMEVVLLLAGTGWLARMCITDLFTVGSSFAVMRRVPVGWWQALFAAALLLLAVGVTRQHTRTRQWALVAWAGLWIFIAVLLHLGNPDAPGDSTYGALAVGGALAFLRQRWIEHRG